MLLLKVTIRLKQSGLNETHLDHINREKESAGRGKKKEKNNGNIEGGSVSDIKDGEKGQRESEKG